MHQVTPSNFCISGLHKAHLQKHIEGFNFLVFIWHSKTANLKVENIETLANSKVMSFHPDFNENPSIEKFKDTNHVMKKTSESILCDVCNRAFRRKDHLKNHEKVAKYSD